MSERILLDLQDHFARKLRTTICDVADTCMEADAQPTEVVMMIMTSLIYELIRSAEFMRMDEKMFLKMCQIAYRDMVSSVRKENEQFG